MSTSFLVINLNHSTPTPKVQFELENDPLTIEQKQKIQKYVDSYLKIPRYINTFRSLKKNELKALSKTYDSFDPSSLLSATSIMDAYHHSRQTGKCLSAFRRIFKNPSENASELGIDPHNAAQIFAAQKFMKVAIQNLSDIEDFPLLSSLYAARLSQGGGYSSVDLSLHRMRGVRSFRVKVSPKYKLLLQNDPVVKLSAIAEENSPLNLLLSRVFFFTPGNDQIDFKPSPNFRNTTRRGDRRGFFTVSSRTEKSHRENARHRIKEEITKLWNDPTTHHIFAALAAIFKKETGSIFLSHTSSDIGLLGRQTFSVLDIIYANSKTMGFYNRKHSVFATSFLCKDTLEVIPLNKGVLVHEVLHFILNRILNNSSSPVKPDSPEEKELDEALILDIKHRKTIDFGRLNSEQKLALASLQNLAAYFPTGFSEKHTKQLQLLRSESIVKVMEVIASGISLKNLYTVAPNLCKFYYKHTKPMIEKFAGLQPQTNDLLRITNPSLSQMIYDFFLSILTLIFPRWFNNL